MAGFLKLNRSYFEHSFWKEERVFSSAEAWLDLIANARFEASPEKLLIRMKTIIINRGEIRAAQRFLAKRWCWSLGKVNRFLKLLEVESMITRRFEHNETVITILNYSKFNPIEINNLNGNGHTMLNGNENADGTQTGTPTERRQVQTKEREEREEGKESLFDRESFYQILEVFYFRNFKSPVAVTTNFFNHYAKTGWNDKNGNPIKSKKAAAENWDNHKTEGVNCPAPLLIQWWALFRILKTETKLENTKFLLIRPAKLENTTLTIRGKREHIEDIENNKEMITAFKKALFTVFGKVTVQYEPDKTTIENESLVSV